MAYYKELLSKAVIGKSKKTIEKEHIIENDSNIDNVLGCWVINHKFNGFIKDKSVIINGTYDINIWYSSNNNTKTNVMIKSFTYEETLNIKLKENSALDETSEIIVRSLRQPSVIDATINDNKIILKVEKELGVEIIGNTIVKVQYEEISDDYEDVSDEDFSINENYL